MHAVVYHRCKVADKDQFLALAVAADEGYHRAVRIVTFDPFEPIGVGIQFPESTFVLIQMVQFLHICLQVFMVCILQQVPVQRLTFIPFVILTEFAAHKQQFFTGVTIHEAVAQTQVGKTLPRVTGHFAYHGALCVYHFVMGQYQYIVFGILICHSKCQFILMIFSVNRVFLDIEQEVVHPAHVPFQCEAKAAFFCVLCHAFPCSTVFRDNHSAGFSLGDDGVHVFQEFDGFQIFIAAVHIGDPLSFASAEIQMQQGCHRIHTQAVNVIFSQPEQSICQQEVAYFFSAVVKDICAPLDMFPQTRVFMFIQGCAVETSQRKVILREVGRYPVQNDANAVFVAGIDEVFEFIRAAVTAGRRIVACYLIAPAAVEGMFFDGKQFQMSITHFFCIGHQFFRQFCISQESVFFPAHPAAQMHFINVHGGFMHVIFLSCCHPAAVFPFIAFQRIQHRCCFGAQFRAEAVRVCFIYFPAVILYHMEFVAVAFLHAGDKDFPDTGFFQFTHGMSAAVPQVEITHNADCFRIGRPNGKGCAFYTLMGHQSAAHFFINFIMSTGTKQMSVQIGESGLEGIGIVIAPCIAAVIGIFQLVTEPFFSVFNDHFKETALMYQFHRVFFTFVCMIDHNDAFCTGQKCTDCHHFLAILFHFVHPQNGMGVTVFPVHDMENIIKLCGIEHILIPFY